jgi:hypothetical protein
MSGVEALGSRRVHLAGCTPTPHALWVTHQARHVTWTLADRPERVRFLIRDRDQKFTERFDEVIRGDGIETIRTPFRAPQANGVAVAIVSVVWFTSTGFRTLQGLQHRYDRIAA